MPVSLARNSAVVESEGGQKFLPPQPPSFLPARAFSFGFAARSAAIRNFVQKRFERRSVIAICGDLGFCAMMVLALLIKKSFIFKVKNHMRNKKVLFGAIFLLSIFVFLFVSVGFASAQEVAKTGFEDICARDAGLAKCIQQLYLLALGLGAIVALLMIVLAGYRYMTAAGNAQQVENAKEAFASAFIGLIVIFIAFILLYLINPDLVKFKGLQLPGSTTTSPSTTTTTPPLNRNAVEVGNTLVNSSILAGATVDSNSGAITQTTSAGTLLLSPVPDPDVANGIRNTLVAGGLDTSSLSFEQYHVSDPNLLSYSMVSLLGGARPDEIAVVAGSLYLFDAEAIRNDASGVALYEAANSIALAEYHVTLAYDTGDTGGTGDGTGGTGEEGSGSGGTGSSSGRPLRQTVTVSADQTISRWPSPYDSSRAYETLYKGQTVSARDAVYGQDINGENRWWDYAAPGSAWASGVYLWAGATIEKPDVTILAVVNLTKPSQPYFVVGDQLKRTVNGKPNSTVYLYFTKRYAGVPYPGDPTIQADPDGWIPVGKTNAQGVWTDTYTFIAEDAVCWDVDEGPPSSTYTCPWSEKAMVGNDASGLIRYNVGSSSSGTSSGGGTCQKVGNFPSSCGSGYTFMTNELYNCYTSGTCKFDAECSSSQGASCQLLPNSFGVCGCTGQGTGPCCSGPFGPEYNATPATAGALASCLGASVVTLDNIGAASALYDKTTQQWVPLYELRFSNGVQISAAGAAKIYNTYPHDAADQMLNSQVNGSCP